jgi:hypothetical protein
VQHTCDAPLQHPCDARLQHPLDARCRHVRVDDARSLQARRFYATAMRRARFHDARSLLSCSLPPLAGAGAAASHSHRPIHTVPSTPSLPTLPFTPYHPHPTVHRYMECRWVSLVFSGKAPAFNLSAWKVHYPWDDSDSAFRSSNATLDAVWRLARYTVNGAPRALGPSSPALPSHCLLPAGWPAAHPEADLLFH